MSCPSRALWRVALTLFVFARCAVEVLEVTMCADVLAFPALANAAHCVVQWYNASRKERPTEEDTEHLQAAAVALQASWKVAFADTGVHSLRFPKMHRLHHIAPSVTKFGPYLEQSTESSESAHRQFKKLYRWCARVLLVLLCCSCFVVVVVVPVACIAADIAVSLE